MFPFGAASLAFVYHAVVVQLNMTVSVPLVKFDGPALVENVALYLQIDRARVKIVSAQPKIHVADAQSAYLRRPADESTAVVVQIAKKDPAALANSAFAEPSLNAPADGWFSTPKSNTDLAEASEASIAELQQLAKTIKEEAGTFARKLQVEQMEVVETMDPDYVPPAIVEEPMEKVSSSDDEQEMLDMMGLIIGVLVGAFFGIIATIIIVYCRLHAAEKDASGNRVGAPWSRASQVVGNEPSVGRVKSEAPNAGFIDQQEMQSDDDDDDQRR